MIIIIISFLAYKKEKRILLLVVLSFLFGIGLFFLGKTNISHGVYLGVVSESKDNYFIFHTGFSYYYVANENSSYETGDILKISGELKDYRFTTYESQFSFKDYLKEKEVYQELDVTSVEILFETPLKVRSFLYANLEKYNDNTKAILGKLLYNVSLDAEYNKLISSDTLFYILSVSSLHVSFINKINSKLLNIRLKEKSADFIIIILTFFIYILSNYKITILKIIIFYLINFYDEYKSKKKKSYLEKVSLCGIILLLLKPYFALGEGFIYCFGLPFYFVLIRDACSSVKTKYQKIVFLGMIFLFMIPLSIYKNGYFSLLSMLLTQILFPIIILMYILGILGIFFPLYPVSNFLGQGIYKLLFLSDGMNMKIWVGEVSFAFVTIYYLILVLFIFFMENKEKRRMKEVFVSLIMIIGISSLPVKNKITSEVDFINVGQGDSILIRNKYTTVLVDTGGIKNKDLALETIIPFLRKKRISKLDYVFITHKDYDHCGAYESLQENFKVVDTNENNSFSSVNINGMEFMNLNPSVSNEENDDSLVLYFCLHNHYFLLMGDASVSVEKKIITTYSSLKVDYLKVGHHGSETSSCDEFIKFISPKEAIISCGEKNIYGHPNKNVLEILENNNVKIKRTDKEGTIKYSYYDF